MEKQILIIDSDTAELRRLREILVKEGYNIMTAADRETAEKILQKIPIGLVICETVYLGFMKPSESQETVE